MVARSLEAMLTDFRGRLALVERAITSRGDQYVTITGTIEPFYVSGFPKVFTADGRVFVVTSWPVGYVPTSNDQVIIAGDGFTYKIISRLTYTGLDFIRPILPTNFVNGWGQYSLTGYPATFTRSSAGIVKLSGLVGSGNAAHGTRIFNLPVGFRPDTRSMFINREAVGPRRIDVLPDGDVVIIGAGHTNTWVSLDNVQFPVAGLATWTDLTLAAGSADVAGYPRVAVWRDSLGMLWYRGALTNPTTVENAVLASTSNPLLTAKPQLSHQVAVGGSDANNPGITHLAGPVAPYGATIVRKGGSVAGYTALDGIHMQADTDNTPWVGLPGAAGVTAYPGAGTTFTPPGYLKRSDGLTFMRGLLQFATATPRDIATMPPGVRSSAFWLRLTLTATGPARLDLNGTTGVLSAPEGSQTWFSIDGTVYAPQQ